MKTYSESDLDTAHQMARRGFFGACAALVAAAVAPERVYSFGKPSAPPMVLVVSWLDAWGGSHEFRVPIDDPRVSGGKPLVMPGPVEGLRVSPGEWAFAL